MFDAVTYGAAVGAAKKYTDEHSGSDDAVKYTAQTLTAAQQAQVRTNIGAGTSDFSGDYRNLTNAPPLVKGNGTGGNTIGGTGGAAMNSAKNLNSYAYGYLAGADANYAFAFGERAFAGNYNRSTGKHAVAIGNNVRAEKDYEWAIGKFNQTNPDTAFAYGDGTSDSDRHNLMELKTDGTLLLNGNAVKVKTGADDYPVLGEICGILPNTGSDASTLPFCYARGIKTYFDTGTTVTEVAFSLSPYTGVNEKMYRAGMFGDFFGYRETSSTTKITFVPNYMRGNMTRILIRACRYMFYNCTSLTIIRGLSFFDTNNSADMKSMFNNCSSLVNLDLSSFDTSNVKNMESMFYRCTSLTNLDISSFDLTNVTAYTNMFGTSNYHTNITTLKTPKINPHDDIPLYKTLYSQDGTAYTNLPVTTGTSIELRASWT